MRPTVHSNGTSASELLGQLENVGGALVTAIKALEGAAPNGRDYYPQGESAIHEAREEHDARLQRLRIVYGEILAMHQGVADQVDEYLREASEGRP